MTTPDEPIENEPSDLRDSKDDDAMRALLKRSLAGEKPAPPAELLRGVQKRIRTRSRGRFFADGWSTTDSRVNYALVATVMLVLIAIAYFALGPLGVTK
jgi:hypothetical protein